jgi:hypothetical protein
MQEQDLEYSVTVLTCLTSLKAFSGTNLRAMVIKHPHNVVLQHPVARHLFSLLILPFNMQHKIFKIHFKF